MLSEATSAIIAEWRRNVEQLHQSQEECREIRGRLRQERQKLRDCMTALRTHMTRPVTQAAHPTLGENSHRHSEYQQLTAREIEVLKHICEGERTKEIAFKLGITFKTVVTHRSNIMEKLGIHEGPNLVRFAIRTGLCKA